MPDSRTTDRARAVSIEEGKAAVLPPLEAANCPSLELCSGIPARLSLHRKRAVALRGCRHATPPYPVQAGREPSPSRHQAVADSPRPNIRHRPEAVPWQKTFAKYKSGSSSSEQMRPVMLSSRHETSASACVSAARTHLPSRPVSNEKASPRDRRRERLSPRSRLSRAGHH